MIRVKTREEIDMLREGGVVLAGILKGVSGMIRPGVSTADLEEFAVAEMEKAGGRPTFKDYKMFNGVLFPTALCASINEEIVHGPALPGRILNDGDIVSIDAGMEYPLNSGRKPRNRFSPGGGYYTDMAFTKIVGRAGKNVRRLLAVTEESLEKAIKKVKPGNTLNDIGSAVQSFVEANGFSVIRELVGHGVGHGLHEDPQVPNYRIRENSSENAVLKEGMVIAIEPMVSMGDYNISIADDDLAIATADGSLSAHFEHTVAVTAKGCRVITEDPGKSGKAKRYLGVDWGEKRIGLALGDDSNRLAVPAGVVGNAADVARIAEEEEIDEIIIGRPFKMADGKQTGNRAAFGAFLNDLKPRISVPFEFSDERMSSKAADALPGMDRDKAPRDSVAAMIILQSFLDKEEI